MKKIVAVSYDYRLKDVLRTAREKFTVHSAFDSAFNLRAAGRRYGSAGLITFYTSVFNQPGTIVIKKMPDGLKTGDVFEAEWPIFRSGICAIDLSGARLWGEDFPPQIRGARASARASAVFRRGKTLIARRLFGNNYTGLHSEPRYFDGKNIKEIVGLGEGLTPAGDDLLLGALNSAFYEKNTFPCAKTKNEWEKVSEAVRNNLRNTNDISASFLKYALEGRISERSMNLLNAINSRAGLTKILSIAETFFGWGATSGRYLLLGLLDFNCDF
jgi:hypothetical protein